MRPLWLLLLTATLGVAVLAGCGDTFVDPFVRDSSALSVYGVLEAGFSNDPPTEHTLRVQSVRTNAEPPRSPDDPALAYQATVTSVDTFTGDSLRRQRRRTQFSDGTYGDLFSATTRFRANGTYDVVIRREGGRTATASVRIPDSPEGTVLAWERRGSRQFVFERVAWETLGLDDATASVEMGCGIRCGFTYETDDVEIDDLGDGRFSAAVNLTEAQRQGCIATTPSEPLALCPSLTLGLVEIRARVLGPEWSRATDPTQSTVESGYGFIGGASRFQIQYQPEPESARAAGFVL